MVDRTGQTWQEDTKIFVVVGPPVNRGFWERHPVCFLDDESEEAFDQCFIDEGGLPWEKQPYMRRLL